MKGATAARRNQRNIEHALSAVRAGSTYRYAAAKHLIPMTTLYYRAIQDGPHLTRTKIGPGRRPELTEFEEQLVVQMICRYAEQGLPLRRQHVQEAVSQLISRMPSSRKMLLSFVNAHPGPNFLRLFIKRHGDKLKLGRPLRQEAVRYAACNAITLTNHFATLEKNIKDKNIQARCIWNLDETGATPARDCKGVSDANFYLTRAGTRDAEVGYFVKVNRVTMMPAICANGDAMKPLFVFKGSRLPFRQVVRDGITTTDSVADFLPSESLLACRRENGGVNNEIFYNWATHLVKHVQQHTPNGHKTLLSFSGYRSHMSLNSINYLHHNNVIVYALPAHTSGKTQPLDVVLFSPFKKYLRDSTDLVVSRDGIEKFDVFDFCGMLRHACEKSFSWKNSITSFRKSEIWPMNPRQLLSAPRPAGRDNLEEVIDVDRMCRLMEAKRMEIRDTVIGANAKILHSGHLDTTEGLVLTSANALALAQEKWARVALKKVVSEERANRVAMDRARGSAKSKKEFYRFHSAGLQRRARKAGLSVEAFNANVRSIEERRAVVRRRTLNKKAIGIRRQFEPFLSLQQP